MIAGDLLSLLSRLYQAKAVQSAGQKLRLAALRPEGPSMQLKSFTFHQILFDAGLTQS
jgi:hypothetical protein